LLKKTKRLNHVVINDKKPRIQTSTKINIFSNEKEINLNFSEKNETVHENMQIETCLPLEQDQTYKTHTKRYICGKKVRIVSFEKLPLPPVFCLPPHQIKVATDLNRMKGA